MIKIAKFCPNCGNQISNNAKFCMECGAKLGDYTSSGAGIEGVIQRSQVGMASVGKVEISPIINTAAGDVCRICGSHASDKCSRCATYICGKHLKKVHTIEQYSFQNPPKDAIDQILLASPAFFCKECFETTRIAKVEVKNILDVDRKEGGFKDISFYGLWNIYGYFTEDELKNQICENCGSYVAIFQCKKCAKMLCYRCLASKFKSWDKGKALIAKFGCPQCNPEWKLEG